MGDVTIILDSPEAVVVHGDWRETLAVAKERGGVDALIVDAPYSAKTHEGHASGGPALGEKRRTKANGVRDTGRERRDIEYAPWDDAEVRAFVAASVPILRGWSVSITDDVLGSCWRWAHDEAGRYTFASVPCVISGMTTRLTGDGPSSEAVYARVARPASIDYSRWGTLPGFYKGPAERCAWVGGKPLWLMLALVRDYSRRGDVVCDPCSGGGTTARAARILGRRFIGGDCDEKAARETARVVSAAREQIALPLGGAT